MPCPGRPSRPDFFDWLGSSKPKKRRWWSRPFIPGVKSIWLLFACSLDQTILWGLSRFQNVAVHEALCWTNLTRCETAWPWVSVILCFCVVSLFSTFLVQTRVQSFRVCSCESHDFAFLHSPVVLIAASWSILMSEATMPLLNTVKWNWQPTTQTNEDRCRFIDYYKDAVWWATRQIKRVQAQLTVVGEPHSKSLSGARTTCLELFLKKIEIILIFLEIALRAGPSASSVLNAVRLLHIFRFQFHDYSLHYEILIHSSLMHAQFSPPVH